MFLWNHSATMEGKDPQCNMSSTTQRVDPTHPQTARMNGVHPRLLVVRAKGKCRFLDSSPGRLARNDYLLE